MLAFMCVRERVSFASKYKILLTRSSCLESELFGYMNANTVVVPLAKFISTEIN